MMRTTAVNGEGKGKQRAAETPESHPNSSSAPISASKAVRPATLSPDTARVGDTHTRTSRFLRKSRSKQHLRDSDKRGGSDNDEALPTSGLSMKHGYAGADTRNTAPPSPTVAPASPGEQQQPPRSTIVSSPLSSRSSSGDKQHAYSPQKETVGESSRSMGGWFTSMLASSQTGQRNINRNDDDAASVRSFATVATSPSRLLQRKMARDSPNRRSTFTYNSNNTGADARSVPASAAQPSARPAIAKIGGFDRMFDRAMQFFTDSDSNADRCPDDIWLLGVRHTGWRPEQDQPPPSPAPSNGGRPSLDTINSESYFHVTESHSNLPKPPASRQLVTSPRRRLSKSSNKSVSSMGAPSPPSIELPPSPPSKSARLFKSRKGTSSESPTLLERTVSGSSSASSSDHHENRNSRFTPDYAARSNSLNGLPAPSDGMHSFSTLSNQGSSSVRVSQVPSPTSTLQTHGWPPAFYHDFYSRLQLTYRSGFAPLSNAVPSGATSSVANAFSNMMTNLNASIGRSMSVANLGDTQAPNGLSSDTGWGCMLRTGQSLLANALVAVHLGRNFRRPLPLAINDASFQSSFTSDSAYSRYVRLLSWFFDDPSPLSPFSVHKFASEGKKLGKQIGEWFGPSTAAGAIKVLANEFTPANLGVALAIDTTLYASEVFHVARGDGVQGWNRPVLILVPLRLGLNGVNPIYHSSLQHYFTLPQCVGIAGGRPSSSYYFVGTQGNQLFYIDPHHTKPSVKAISVPENLQRSAQQQPLTVANHGTASSREKASQSQLDQFFAKAYSPKDLESFHCEKVRKMSLSALDPSMLVGLLCQSKEDWEDLCRRMKEFPTSKDHHPIINIVQEMPAWMRKSSRTISGAGLNASTSSQKPAVKPIQARSELSSTTSLRGSTKALSGDDFEGSSVDYADSDDWDIDDSDDEDNNVISEGSEQEECNVDASIVMKPSPSPFQEVVPGSFESDEPDYRASRNNGRSPVIRTQHLTSVPKMDETEQPTSPDDDFERMSTATTTREVSLSPSEGEAVIVPPVPAKSPLTAEQKKAAARKEEEIEIEADTEWQTLNGRSA